jgi:DNA-binding transcriptional MerR regulator
MPRKLFYRIGEACKQLDIQPYVLRYWETEFPVLSPKKSKSGQRVYSQEELELIRRIKELLYEEGYTIAGAKKKLEAELESGGNGSAGEDAEELAAEGRGESGGALDSDATERIQQLERGLRSALKEARGILRLLGPR